jgi:hypothetical protein
MREVGGSWHAEVSNPQERGQAGSTRGLPGAKNDKAQISMGDKEAEWSIGPAVKEEVEWTKDRQSAAESLPDMA